MRSMLLDPPSGAVAPSLELSLIDQAASEAKDVTVSESFLDNLMTLRKTLMFGYETSDNEKTTISYEDVEVSDRRWKWGLRFAKACAWLDGKPDLRQDDIRYLLPVLWSEESQIEKLEAAIYKLCSKEMQKAEKAITVGNESFNFADGTADRQKLTQGLAELEDRINELKESFNARNPHREIVRAGKALRGMQKSLKAQLDKLDRIIDEDADEWADFDLDLEIG